ncbi:hypothetical protein ACOMHN_029336 [Nucella lapillus]
MPTCRREQTKFAIFLAVLVTLEVISIVTFMHIEHRKVARRLENFQEEMSMVVAAPPDAGGIEEDEMAGVLDEDFQRDVVVGDDNNVQKDKMLGVVVLDRPKLWKRTS